jgi:uncharacterized membrane protein
MKRIDITLKIVFAIQIAILSITGLDTIGLQIAILRQIIGFVYLTFIPGILLLKIFELDKLHPIERLLYTVGLSIAFVTVTGVLVNEFYPLIGVSKPISTAPLLVTLSVLVVVLCVISHKRCKTPLQSICTRPTKKVLASMLFLCLIPLLSILGTFFVVCHQSNLLLLSSFIMIALAVFLIALSRFVPKKLYPLAIVAIALALFYQYTLISPYLTGSDINLEYYFSNLVMKNSLWNPTISALYNGAVSVVMLTPTYSIVLGMDAAWVFKIIYPLIFSLVPLGFYRIYREQTNEKVAFLSVFFFMSFFPFFTELMALERQQIAELFLVLLILLMIDKNMGSIKRMVLCTSFAALLAISHYGLSYIFMLFFLIAPWILLLLIRNSTLRRLFQNIRGALHINKGTNAQSPTPYRSRILTVSFIIFYACFALSWYLYVSSSTAIAAFANVGKHIISGISTGFFNPASRGTFVLQALGSGPQVESWQRETSRAIQYVTEVFIVVGILKLILKPEKLKLNLEYYAITLCSTGLLLASIILPYFASSLNMTRIYQIALLFLSPICIIGGMTIFNEAMKLFRTHRIRRLRVPSGAAVFLLSLVLIAYFLFSTGFIEEVTAGVPFSISLNPERMETSISSEKMYFNSLYTFESEVFSARWLAGERSHTSLIYADADARSNVLASYGMIAPENSAVLSNNTKDYYGDTYVYLKRLNVVDGLISTGGNSYFNTSETSSVLDSMNRIYSNGESDIYRPAGA